MASLAAGVGVAVGGCVALALALPAFALKEVLEKRTRRNLRRHLGRRHTCKISFGDMDAPITPSKTDKARALNAAGVEPPLYDELFERRQTPPPPYPNASVAQPPLRSALRR